MRALLTQQTIDFVFEFEAFEKQRVAGSDGGDFRHADRGLILEIHLELAIVVADAVDHPKLHRIQVPQLGVDGALGNVSKDFNFKVWAIQRVGVVLGRRGGKQIALPNDSTFALLDV